MSKYICLVFSDNIFGGFEHYFQLTLDVDTLDELVCSAISKLEQTLIYNNMEVAIEILKRKQFHIHGLTLENIRNRKVEETVYVCSHCN
jgi:hypothetical protein